ncbi:MAG TPA: penicillin-binding protein 1C [Gammaproteobacteria bacterium]|nr:penicillin-binding protein 1C [Gammaproteobacteria bacterium]
MKISIVAAIAALAIVAFGSGRDMPDFFDVRAKYISSEAVLRDRHGEIIQTLRVDVHGRRLAWTPLDEISPRLIEVVVRAEDHRFYRHHGVDGIALLGAAWSDISGGPRRGGSTITMQLAALLDRALQPGGGGRSLGQKLKQVGAALALERTWSKNEILEAYFNLANFRGELQGIAAATRGLFGKSPSGINKEEAYVLAALLRAPAAPSALVFRHACASGRSEDAQFECVPLTALVAQALSASKTPFLRMSPDQNLALHVAHQLLDSRTRDAATTLDAGIQRRAFETLRHQLMGLQEQQVRDGAVLAVDNLTGDVLAYVGNAGDESSAPYVDGVRAPRQAGSTLKPFLYELALERKLITAASLLDDAPINLMTPTGLYVPQDYDRDFRGWVSARTSLAGSLNVPAVRTLMLVGLDAFVQRLQQLGFALLTEPGDYYGYSLALGSGEVTLWQLVQAYRVLANGGVFSPLRLRPAGTPPPSQPIMNTGAGYIVSDILADAAARSVSFGLDNALATPYWSAVKTGTSKDMRDNWCVGYTPRYTVGVWVGNFNGDPMRSVSGVTGAAPVWREVMDALNAGERQGIRSPPAAVVADDVRFTPAVEPARSEWFLAGTETSVIALSHDTHTARIAYPGRDMIIAVDPDIPAGRQRVRFSATEPGSGLHWQLDGKVARSEDWSPEPGAHHLALLDSTGQELDRVRFQVRGPKPSDVRLMR